MSYLDRVFLWLGNTNKSQSEITEYFKLDYSVEGDFDDPNYKICGFCKDINEKWYDEDFIGYLKFNDNLSIEEILEEVPIALYERDKILSICKELNIEEVNATFWYSGEIEAPSKDITYSGLNFIGEFDLD